MAQSELGELERVDVKNHWPNESTHFTPWLAANIDQLGKAIGMSLEVVETEKAVGRYSADIYARNEDDTMVVIENQYGPTDHDHLGKALTYAAGLAAKTVVWISEKFGSEHLATLNWLNSMTGDELAFFGVEVQLWKIGDSPLAPRFEVVSKPNRFADTLKARVTHGQLTPGQRLQLEFWQAYALSIESETLPFKSGKPGPRNWFIHTIGEGNVYLQGIASTWNSDSNSYDGGELRAELAIDIPEAKQLVAVLEVEKEAIHGELGAVLHWHNPEDKKMSRLYLQKSVDIKDKNEWPSQHLWLRENLVRMYEVLKPRIAEGRTIL